MGRGKWSFVWLTGLRSAALALAVRASFGGGWSLPDSVPQRRKSVPANQCAIYRRKRGSATNARTDAAPKENAVTRINATTRKMMSCAVCDQPAPRIAGASHNQRGNSLDTLANSIYLPAIRPEIEISQG